MEHIQVGHFLLGLEVLLHQFGFFVQSGHVGFCDALVRYAVTIVHLQSHFVNFVDDSILIL